MMSPTFSPNYMEPVTPNLTAYDNKQWKYISPIHIVLSFYIITQNSLIIYHYHKDWKRLSSLLFMLIAAADSGFACSELGRATLVILCTKNSLLRVSTWITMIWLLTGQFWSATSAFLCLILTVVKTINIINPFYQLKTRSLYTVIFIVLLIYFTLFITDNYYGNWLVSYATYGKHKFKCSVTYGLFAFFDTTASTGELTLTYIFKRLRLIIIYDYVASALLVLEFCLPGIIVLVCMMLQMFYIRRSLGRSENPMENTANHVNLTVFLTSLLYFISVSVFSYFLLVLDIKAAIGVNITDFSNLILIIGKYTLPLLNAALFPTILILRKPELKAIFKNYVMKILLLPHTIFYKLQSVVLRRSGYTQI